MNRPTVLDIDHSIAPPAESVLVPLAHWQEALRFGCSLRTLRRFESVLAELPLRGPVLLGSGDFHHLSWPLIARVPGSETFQVVVLDNHPDNMLFPFGVHCGSWVRRVALLPRVAHVHVVGIGSGDIGAGHAWENYRAPLRDGRLTYWSVGVDVSWAARSGLGHAFRGFDSAAALIAAFREYQADRPLPAYLSIDKDVFAENVARTNWDQGVFQLEDALAVIDTLRSGLVGSDITGEVSHYRYRSLWKRLLSARDAQLPVDTKKLSLWQAQQQRLNERLLAAIAERTETYPAFRPS